MLETLAAAAVGHVAGKAFDSIADEWFGGSEADASQQQQDAFGRSGRELRQGYDIARGETNVLMGAGKEDINKGFSSALDLWNRVLPNQLQVYQDGNVSAQKMNLAGMEQAHNALLGNPVNYGALQPERLHYRTDNLGAEYPDFYKVPEKIGYEGQPSFEEQNIPPEANYIRDRLQTGEIDYDTAVGLMTTGEGYSDFRGLPLGTAKWILRDSHPGTDNWTVNLNQLANNYLGRDMTSGELSHYLDRLRTGGTTFNEIRSEVQGAS